MSFQRNRKRMRDGIELEFVPLLVFNDGVSLFPKSSKVHHCPRHASHAEGWRRNTIPEKR